MKTTYHIPDLPLPYDLETRAVLRALNSANRSLAELKGVTSLIPDPAILINTLALQEAGHSSAIENIITTSDRLYRDDIGVGRTDAATKEVQCYRRALNVGYRSVERTGLITEAVIRAVQQELVGNSAGFRAVPGTALLSADGTVVYEPPQDSADIRRHIANLICYINDPALSDADPLLKMCIIHHQFESIHPFYDGNGRTGRILNVLYLVAAGLLELPVLYLSRYIVDNKGEYYRLLQAVRQADGVNAAEWEQWVLFMLRGVEQTARQTAGLVRRIAAQMSHTEQQLRALFGSRYRAALTTNLFRHPYTRASFLASDLNVDTATARRLLDRLVHDGLLEKQRLASSCFYINSPLLHLLADSD